MSALAMDVLCASEERAHNFRTQDMAMSKWDYYGQRSKQIRDPLGFRLKHAIAPWKTNPEIAKQLKEEDESKDEPTRPTNPRRG